MSASALRTSQKISSHSLRQHYSNVLNQTNVEQQRAQEITDDLSGSSTVSQEDYNNAIDALGQANSNVDALTAQLAEISEQIKMMQEEKSKPPPAKRPYRRKSPYISSLKKQSTFEDDDESDAALPSFQTQ